MYIVILNLQSIPGYGIYLKFSQIFIWLTQSGKNYYIALRKRDFLNFFLVILPKKVKKFGNFTKKSKVWSNT